MKRLLLSTLVAFVASGAFGQKTVSVTYRINGNNPYENNHRVSYLNIDCGDGTPRYKSVTTDTDGLTDTYTVPEGQELSITENVRYHGFNLSSITKDDAGNLTVDFDVDAGNEYQYLWYSNSPEGHPYRIPAIASTRKGVLLAVTDYRPSNRDIGYGEVDLMLRRSFDSGQTWDAPSCIADGVPASAPAYPFFGYGFGDAALVADRESDEVLIVCVSGRVVYSSASAGNQPCIARLRSHDGGETWTEPENITSQFFGVDGSLLMDSGNGINCYGGFFASGKILQSRIVKKGDYYRLYAAMLCRGSNVSGAYVVYSDDFGQTWQLLSPNTVKAASASDEPKVEELPNGNIVLSGRKSKGRYFNVFHFDDETFTTGSWGNALQSDQQDNGIAVGNNSCNGEILIVYGKRADGQYPNNVYPIALQSLPWGSSRINVGIWWKPLSFNTTYNYTSELISRNWNTGLEVSDRGSAYSTMCVQPDNRIAFFYEEEPNNYCMVYVPLTLEQVTNGQYRMYDPVADGLPSTVSASSTPDPATYDLSGRPLPSTTSPASPLRKGIYIRGGRKIVIR